MSTIPDYQLSETAKTKNFNWFKARSRWTRLELQMDNGSTRIVNGLRFESMVVHTDESNPDHYRVSSISGLSLMGSTRPFQKKTYAMRVAWVLAQVLREYLDTEGNLKADLSESAKESLAHRIQYIRRDLWDNNPV